MSKKPKSRPMWSIILFAWILFFVVGYIFTLDFSIPKEEVTFGTTFSEKYAEETLQLNWHETFQAILEDIQFKEIRLMTYWDEVEKTQGEFNFENVDWMLNKARDYDVKVTLVVGKRQPRWPECHIPAWVRKLNEEKQQEVLLNYITKTVERYKDESLLSKWQVENEPLLEFFGECDPLNKEFFRQEIELVKKLDPNHQVMTTASGEFDDWGEATKFTDVVGVSLYRVIAKKFIGKIYYPLPPAFYRWRADLNPNTEGLFISELQAEPWTVKKITDVPIETYYEQMDANKLKENVDFAVATGFDTIWVWGAEWWYWLKIKQNQSMMWEAAQEIFNK